MESRLRITTLAVITLAAVGLASCGGGTGTASPTTTTLAPPTTASHSGSGAPTTTATTPVSCEQEQYVPCAEGTVNTAGLDPSGLGGCNPNFSSVHVSGDAQTVSNCLEEYEVPVTIDGGNPVARLPNGLPIGIRCQLFPSADAGEAGPIGWYAVSSFMTTTLTSPFFVVTVQGYVIAKYVSITSGTVPNSCASP